MIEIKSKLNFIYKATVAYTDYSHKTNNFGRDEVSIDVATTDFIYIGFKKPISKIYFNHNTTYSTDAILTVSMWNGSSFVACTVDDETLGLRRPGFIHITKPSTEYSTTINSTVGYFLRLSVSAARAGLKVSGCNLVFSDDYDLSIENPLITQPEYLGSSTSFILNHVASRDEILKRLATKNVSKKKDDGTYEDYNQWDLFDINEVKQSSVFLTLSKIYFNLSDAADDIWMQKSNDYRAKYSELIEKVALSLDMNDDGIKTSDESKSFAPYMVKCFR